MRLRLGIGTKSLLAHSIDPTRDKVSSLSRGGEVDSTFMGRTAEPLYNGVFIPRTIESWRHFYNLPSSFTGLAKGLRKQTSKGSRLVSTKQVMSSIRISCDYSVKAARKSFKVERNLSLI